MPKIKVLIVDDHPVVRAGIADLLSKAPDIWVVGEASQGDEVMALVKERLPDVVLLDIEMPGMDGVQVAQQLRDAGAQARILAISAHDEKQYIKNLLALGAAGYLIKDEVPENIVEAVRGVYSGEGGWVSRKVAALLTSVVGLETEEEQELSLREHQVLQGVVAGKTNQEIGYSLGISARTVEKHIEGIFTKLGASSRVEAAVAAIRAGLVA